MSVLDLNRGDRAPTSPFIQEFYSCLVVQRYTTSINSVVTRTGQGTGTISWHIEMDPWQSACAASILIHGGPFGWLAAVRKGSRFSHTGRDTEDGAQKVSFMTTVGWTRWRPLQVLSCFRCTGHVVSIWTPSVSPRIGQRSWYLQSGDRVE
jgi:hypothetical protein